MICLYRKIAVQSNVELWYFPAFNKHDHSLGVLINLESVFFNFDMLNVILINLSLKHSTWHVKGSCHNSKSVKVGKPSQPLQTPHPLSWEFFKKCDFSSFFWGLEVSSSWDFFFNAFIWWNYYLYQSSTHCTYVHLTYEGVILHQTKLLTPLSWQWQCTIIYLILSGVWTPL